MASRKFESEAASMFEEENFDAAYRGTVPSAPDISDADDVDDDGDEDAAESTDEDEAAWASAESEETAESAEETDDAGDEDDADEEVEEEETEDDDDAEVSAAREILAKRSSNVAKKRGEGMTKAEMIRNEIEKRKQSGNSLRACDIISALGDKGVEVNASQVSVTLRSMGVESTRTPRTPKSEKAETPTRGRKAKAEGETVVRVATRKTPEKAVAVKTPARSDEAFTESDLTATAAFISAVGSADRGTTLLRIFSRMNG